MTLGTPAQGATKAKPEYFSVFKERSIAGLRERLVELKGKVAMLEGEDCLATNELETLGYMVERLGSDVGV